jgi:hypothetical protein
MRWKVNPSAIDVVKSHVSKVREYGSCDNHVVLAVLNLCLAGSTLAHNYLITWIGNTALISP